MQRQSQLFRLEAPIGGWNTRDSLDNIPPQDAVVLTNWVPDLGEVRTRPGYDEHCWTGDIVSGAELVSNPGFETAGAGGADVFADWDEVGTYVTITQDSVDPHGGTYCCKIDMTAAPTSGGVRQTLVTSASTTYVLTFYYKTEIYDGSQPVSGAAYSIYDVSNSAYLVSRTFLEPKGDWTEAEVQFTTVAGGISTQIYLMNVDSYQIGTVYIDDVSVKQSVPPDDIETLAVYESGSTDMLIGFDSTHCFDFSTTGSPTEITNDGAAFTVGRWQWANHDGKIGFVNGTDAPKYYPNGSGNLDDMTLSGSGMTAANVIGIHTFKNRTWFWEDGSQDVWYSALNTLGGACTKFPLSRVGQFGGNLICMTTWTHDGGSGPDDYAVFIMSSGECIVYQGSSPAVGGDWALVGIYNIGEPLSVRSVCKYGGDVIIITRLDYVNLNRVIPGVEADSQRSKIVKGLRDAIGTGGSLWGWEANVYPRGQLAIFNVPTSASTYDQHVMNTVTGAWCKWTGINAHTWQFYDNNIYFGAANGYVYKFDSGNDDDGTGVESELQTAWLPIGGYGNKMITAVREFLYTNADIDIVNNYSVDFEDFEEQDYPSAIASGFASWGDPWGTPWTSADQIFKDWQTVGIYGEVVSLRKRLTTKQRVRYLGSSWLYRPGERL